MIMKKQLKYILTFAIIGMLFAACTDNFESLNSKEGAYSEEKQKMDNGIRTIYFTAIQQGIYFNDAAIGENWPFQTMQNLNADMFSGYYHDMVSKFFESNSSYNLNNGWNATNWKFTYQHTVPALNKSEQSHLENKSLFGLGLTKILKVATMHRITDQYGPIVYPDVKFFFDSKNFHVSSQEEAYKMMFADLDEGIRLLREALAEGAPENSFEKYDILMKAGNRKLSSWMRWANSLRLRLAIRVSNVNKILAQTEVKKTFEDEIKIGLIETNAQTVEVSTDKGYSNPLGAIGLSWSEVYMNASMESFLVGYDDPRASKYFTPATPKKEEKDKDGNVIVIPDKLPEGCALRFEYAGTFKGIPIGLGRTKNIPAENNAYSRHSRGTITQQTPAPLMTAAEVWFLRAEAALRGLSSENVADCYTKGVQASFEQWGVSHQVVAYLDSENKPSDYVDAFDPKCDMKAVSTITPKWDDGASREEKLERIITQKWLAMYPEGAEAWTEQRRTGYPKLFKVLNNESQGTIDTDVMIRRLPFPSNLKTDQPALYAKLLEVFGKDDTGGQRLWWDTGTNEF